MKKRALRILPCIVLLCGLLSPAALGQVTAKAIRRGKMVTLLMNFMEKQVPLKNKARQLHLQRADFSLLPGAGPNFLYPLPR